MPQLEWDKTGERLFETGVNRGVLYPYDSTNKKYTPGVAWNGLTAVNETPSGAEPTPIYADNIKYQNLMSAEEFGFTVEAFTYPDEFAICDGTAAPITGATVAQQSRKTFGLSYRTLLGNDIQANDYGYKLHLIWGALASPSEKAYATVNDSPEAITFSWTATTTPVEFAGSRNLKPTSLITVDSTKIDKPKLAALEAILYGSAEGEATPYLPLPEEVLAILEGVTTPPAGE